MQGSTQLKHFKTIRMKRNACAVDKAHEKAEIRDGWRDGTWTVLNPLAVGCLDSYEGKYQYCPHQRELWGDLHLGTWHPTCKVALTPRLPCSLHPFHKRAFPFFGMF